MKKALALLVITALSVLAQIPKPGGGGGPGGSGATSLDGLSDVAVGSSPPGTCTDNSFYVDTSEAVPADILKICKSNVWYKVAELTGGLCIDIAGREISLCSSVPLLSSGASDPSGANSAGELYLQTTTKDLWIGEGGTTWRRVTPSVFALVDTGGDDTYGNSTACAGFPATYVDGQVVILQATTANTGAATLDCRPGAKAIKLSDGTTDPATGDVVAFKPTMLQYKSSADGGSGAWIIQVTSASSGGGSAGEPYVATVTTQTTLTVTAATHGWGINPVAFCFDGGTPRVAAACNYSKDSDGQIVFTWAPAFTGQVVIMSAGGGDELMAVRAVTGTTDTALNADCGGMVTYSNASAIAVTLPQAGASSEFVAGCIVRFLNKGAGTVTVTPTTSTLGGAASVALGTGEWLDAVSDGTDYEISATNRAAAGDNITLTKARTGVTVASNPTGTTSTCFQLETGGTGPKLCDESNGLQIKTSADVVMATLTAAGVLTLGDGTAPWNLTGLTDDVAPGAPGSANQFTSYIDRTTGLFSWHLNGEGSPRIAALGNTSGNAIAVPSGTGPTIDAAGKVGVDTTTDQFRFYGGAERALPSIQTISFVIPAPADTDDINIFKAPYGMTILGIDAIVQGTTSVTGQLQECAADGTSCADLDSDIVADADGAADDGSLTDSAIASGAWIRWKTTSVSGTPTFLTVTARYRVVPD